MSIFEEGNLNVTDTLSVSVGAIVISTREEKVGDELVQKVRSILKRNRTTAVVNGKKFVIRELTDCGMSQLIPDAVSQMLDAFCAFRAGAWGCRPHCEPCVADTSVCDKVPKKFTDIPHLTRDERIALIGEGVSMVEAANRKLHISTRKKLRKPMWEAFYPTSDGWCVCCGNPLKFKNMHAGHVLAFSQGGATVLENLRPVCRTCNLTMHTTHMLSYFTSL
jgi:5-methylcytosine-specific restriction endonuclease McrA